MYFPYLKYCSPLLGDMCSFSGVYIFGRKYKFKIPNG